MRASQDYEQHKGADVSGSVPGQPGCVRAGIGYSLHGWQARESWRSSGRRTCRRSLPSVRAPASARARYSGFERSCAGRSDRQSNESWSVATRRRYPRSRHDSVAIRCIYGRRRRRVVSSRQSGTMTIDGPHSPPWPPAWGGAIGRSWVLPGPASISTGGLCA
jgi:hypothetical protein